LSDEYFLRLGAYKDYAQSISYTDGLSSRALNFYRMLGVLAFYGSEFAVRPWRMVRLLQNLLQHRQESRLDKSLRDLADRIKNRRRSATTKAGLAPG
jgi:hypothetical protein